MLNALDIGKVQEMFPEMFYPCLEFTSISFEELSS